MTPRDGAVSHHGKERWRWLLYVAFAIGGALLTFAAARAEQKATDYSTFRKLTDDYCAAWSTNDPKAAAHFYAQDGDRVFYDLAPFSYHGWKEYEEGVKKEFFSDPNFESAKLTAGKDLKVSRRGMIAWTTVPIHFSEKMKDGKNIEMEIRYTGIWERRGSHWVLVHEHLSAPLK